MKKNLFILFLVIVNTLLSAQKCYEMKTVYKENTNKENTKKVYFSCTYPIFKNIKNASKINRQILYFIAGDSFSVERLAESYCDIDLKVVSGKFSSFETEIVLNESDFLTVKTFHTLYQYPAAHPQHIDRYLVFDKKNGNLLKLSDIFKENYETELNNLINDRYKQMLMTEDFIGFDEPPIEYTNNFALDNKTIIFLYNEYEIGPYVAGSIEVDISYDALSNILKQPLFRNKQSLPPDLFIENLIFSEPSHNKALDGLEKGSIQFDIVNKGRGNAYDIEVAITPLTSSQNLSFNTKTEINQISKKDYKNISIPISAEIDVENLFREFRIEVTESNGFYADPAKISFETLTFAAPNLKVEQIAIDDNEDAEGEGFSYGNGNSIIEQNESVEVTAYVQNFGEGMATNVKAKVILTSANRDFTYPDEGKIFNLGDIESGDFRKVDFYFYTSRRYDEKNIPLSIELSESTGKFGKTANLGLKLGD